MNFISSAVPTIQLHDDIFKAAGIEVFVKRLDLIHPIISGNKWYKLKYNLLKAEQEKKTTILTFGGAYSNHIAATAAATKIMSFKSIGIIRGEKPAELNPVLKYAGEQQMELIYISREEYRKKNEKSFLEKLITNFNDVYIIPEGGANAEGVMGCREILSEEEKKFDYLFVACGTATTLSGLVLACNNSDINLRGISVLKNEFSLEKNVNQFLTYFDDVANMYHWEILHDYHFGGYAKYTSELTHFIEHFIEKHNIFIEPVYTGKVFFAVYDFIKKELIPSGSKILIIHTGGFRGGPETFK
ncbi:MAG: 1-aminocyclopropane-1-carboxylate deaminase/D-cysteine desulfhydrase [Bacteroidia bacterium]